MKKTNLYKIISSVFIIFPLLLSVASNKYIDLKKEQMSFILSSSAFEIENSTGHKPKFIKTIKTKDIYDNEILIIL